MLRKKGIIRAAAAVVVLVGVLAVTLVATAAPDRDTDPPLKAALDAKRGDTTKEVVDTFQADVKSCMEALGFIYYEDPATMPPLDVIAEEAYTAALVGTDVVPGCLKQGLQAFEATAPPAVDPAFFKRAEARPAYKAALKAWQKCMAGKGFGSVKNPDHVPAAAQVIIVGGGVATSLEDRSNDCLTSSGLADLQASIIVEYENLGG